LDLKMQTNAVKLLLRLSEPSKTVETVIPFVPQKRFIKDSCVSEPLRRTSPEKKGISSSHLEDFVSRLLADKELNLHNLLVVCDGEVIFEGSYGPHRPDVPHAVYSQSKTVTALAIGMLVDDGLLSLDERVIKIFEKKATPLSQLTHKDLTVEHLLTMTSGALFNELGAVTETDWLKAFLQTALLTEPGKVFGYNSMNSYVLAEIVKEKTGESLFDFLKKRLFDPLGIRDCYWEKSPAGVEKGGWGLYIMPEDMAKIGCLFANGGIWQGRRIVSSEWIRRSVKAHAKAPESYGRYDYGYHLWVNRTENSYLFNGFFGQNLLVYPDHGIVIASNAAVSELFQQSSYYETADRFFGHAFHRSDALRVGRDYRSLSRLADKMNRQGEPDRLTRSFRLREKKELLSFLNGKVYRFDSPQASRVGLMPLVAQIFQNNYTAGITRLAFFAENESRLFVEADEGAKTHRFEVGFDSAVYTPFDFNGEVYECAVSGRLMRNEDDLPLLKLDLAFTENASSRQIRLLFEGDCVTAHFSETPNETFVFAFVDFFAGEMLNKKITDFIASASDGNFLSNLKTKGKQIFAPVLEGKLLETESDNLSNI